MTFREPARRYLIPINTRCIGTRHFSSKPCTSKSTVCWPSGLGFEPIAKSRHFLSGSDRSARFRTSTGSHLNHIFTCHGSLDRWPWASSRATDHGE
jgi:hypothetical protein